MQASVTFQEPAFFLTESPAWHLWLAQVRGRAAGSCAGTAQPPAENRGDGGPGYPGPGDAMRTAGLQLIEDYRGHVDEACRRFATVLGVQRPLRAYRDGRIASHGALDPQGGIAYRFRDNGCEVMFDEVCVDFDFGPHDRVDGFDLQRLSRFVKSQPRIWPHFQDPLALKRAFAGLKDAGVIVCPRWSPGTHLCYLAETVAAPAQAPAG